MPDSESNGKWNTTFGTNFETVPENVCPHVASSYTYED
jgi:hypothetical protein